MWIFIFHVNSILCVNSKAYHPLPSYTVMTMGTPLLLSQTLHTQYNTHTTPLHHWGPWWWWCHMSILRNGNVACLCCLFSPMSHFEFKKGLCPMSLYFVPPCRISLSLMLHFELKNCPCRPVDLRGRGPYHTSVGACCRVSVIGTACTASFSSFAEGTS